MANGSLSSTSGGEGEIRKAIVEADLVDCIISMPSQLFLTTGIPVCLWFVTRDKSGKYLDKGRGGRDRSGETLFIDAREMGQMETRTLRFLTGRDHPASPPTAETDIGRIVRTYHAWRGEKNVGDYGDVKGFCKAAQLEDIRKYNYVLTPGTYAGSAAREIDSEPFEEKMQRLVGDLSDHLAASDTLTAEIRKSLGTLGYEF
jgi:type I restriction enzyme M protein